MASTGILNSFCLAEWHSPRSFGWGPVPARKSLDDEPASWVAPVGQRLKELLNLEFGWDGYRGQPVKTENAIFALSMLQAICGQDTPAPQIIPGVDGDLQVEWHTFDGDLELHIMRPNLVHGWFSRAGEEDTAEVMLTSNFEIASAWVNKVTESEIAAEFAAA